MLNVIALLASLCIIGGYARLAIQRKPKAFHWANAIGCIPIIIQNSLAHVWAALILTTFFGLIGWMGLAIGYTDAKKAAKRKVENSYWSHVQQFERGMDSHPVYGPNWREGTELEIVDEVLHKRINPAHRGEEAQRRIAALGDNFNDGSPH